MLHRSKQFSKMLPMLRMSNATASPPAKETVRVAIICRGEWEAGFYMPTRTICSGSMEVICETYDQNSFALRDQLLTAMKSHAQTTFEKKLEQLTWTKTQDERKQALFEHATKVILEYKDTVSADDNQIQQRISEKLAAHKTPLDFIKSNLLQFEVRQSDVYPRLEWVAQIQKGAGVLDFMLKPTSGMVQLPSSVGITHSIVKRAFDDLSQTMCEIYQQIVHEIPRDFPKEELILKYNIVPPPCPG